MLGTLGTYLKAGTQRRLKGGVVRAKSRQRSRTEGAKRQDKKRRKPVLLEESNAYYSIMFYIGLLSRKSKILY